jgi:hypothetical protein
MKSFSRLSAALIGDRRGEMAERISPKFDACHVAMQTLDRLLQFACNHFLGVQPGHLMLLPPHRRSKDEASILLRLPTAGGMKG